MILYTLMVKHDYKSVLNDLKMFLPKLKNNGVIGGHDWGHEWDSVKDVVFRTIGEPDMFFNDTSWIKELVKNIFIKIFFIFINKCQYYNFYI